MGKESAAPKLSASKGAQSPSREIATEIDSRAPLSPILVKPRNNLPAHQRQQHQVHFHPTSQVSGLKKNTQIPPSTSLRIANSADYLENVTTSSPRTTEHKFAAPATPKSAGKRRFGWSNTRQHEDPLPGSLLFSSLSYFTDSSLRTLSLSVPYLYRFVSESSHALDSSDH